MMDGPYWIMGKPRRIDVGVIQPPPGATVWSNGMRGGREGIRDYMAYCTELIQRYPDRLIDRLRQYDTTVVLLGAYDGSGFSSGVDDGQGFADVPARFDGAVWTNRIDRIGPLSRSLP